jgi:hypothetical protein
MSPLKYVVQRAAAECIVEYSAFYDLVDELPFTTNDVNLSRNGFVLFMNAIVSQNGRFLDTLAIHYRDVINRFGRTESASCYLDKRFREEVGCHTFFFSEVLLRKLNDTQLDLLGEHVHLAIHRDALEHILIGHRDIFADLNT